MPPLPSHLDTNMRREQDRMILAERTAGMPRTPGPGPSQPRYAHAISKWGLACFSLPRTQFPHKQWESPAPNSVRCVEMGVPLPLDIKKAIPWPLELQGIKPVNPEGNQP